MGNAGAAGGPGGRGPQIEDKYFLQKVKLGQGSFGTVWRAVDRSNDKVVAIKQLDKATMPKRQVTRKDIEREVELMKAVRHDNITQLFDTFEDEKSIFLALEYCDGGDFGDKVKERGMSLREEEAADWMAQICSAIAALHMKGICHRDIKPDNFMVAVTTLKLSDFGLACFLPRGKLLTDKCGTPAFMAPEQVQLPKSSRGYGIPCDMWAAGISMYMLMFGGRHPFLTAQNQLDERMLLQGKLDFREGAAPSAGFLDGLLGGGQRGTLRFSEKARQLCSNLVQPNQALRIQAEDALKDPWFAIARRRPSNPPVAVQAAQAATPLRQSGRNAGYSAQEVPQASPQAMAQAQAAGVFPAAQAPGGTQAQLQIQQQRQADQRRIRSLETKNAQLQNALVTAKQQTQPMQVPGRAGPLRVGLRCRYYSPTYGWMSGHVQGMNDQDGTYNLDVRQHAAPDKISPPDKPATAEEIWSPGTWVCYESSSMGTYLPGVITGYNTNDGTYNLDLREHAAVDKIRARIGDGSASAASSDEYRPDGMRTERNQDGMRTDADLQAAPAPPNGLQMGTQAIGTEGANPGYFPQPSGMNVPPIGRTSSAAPSQRPPDGGKCMIVEQPQGYPEFLPALIEGFNQTDGSYSLLVEPNGARRRQQAWPEMMRAPRSEAEAWPAGTQVFYESTSLNTWLPATIVSFNSANGTYNLDVRENAQPERVRPR